MATPQEEAIRELIRQSGEIQRRIAEVEQPEAPIRTILAPGQDVGDLLTNPTTAQARGLGAAAGRLLSGGNIVEAAQSGLGTLEKARLEHFATGRARADRETEALQDQLKNIRGAIQDQATLATQGRAARAEVRDEAAERRAQSRFEAEKAKLTNIGNITFADGTKGIVGFDPAGNPVVVDASGAQLAARTGLTPAAQTFKLPTGFMLRDPEDPSKGVQPIPGGPADTLTPEQGAKAQLVQGALENATVLDRLIFEGGDVLNGEIDRTNIASSAVSLPGTQGRTLNVLLKDAIEAKIRAESGAAVPETEVVRAAERFRPSMFDSDETIRVKRLLLQQFLAGTFDKFDPTGRFKRTKTIDALTEQMDEIVRRVADEEVSAEEAIQELENPPLNVEGLKKGESTKTMINGMEVEIRRD